MHDLYQYTLLFKVAKIILIRKEVFYAHFTVLQFNIVNFQ